MVNKLVITSAVVLLLAYLTKDYFGFGIKLPKSPIIQLADGKIQGVTQVSRDGRHYFGFLGVPFAKPPVGSLRFEPPEPLDAKWEGVKDASEYGANCIQINQMMEQIEGQEDCLFLNIYTPKLKGSALPVMVFIHGGLFTFGSGSGYRGDYFMDEDVVLVTINYRLGSFGFLNTGDEQIRGNMGLKDQNMALQWIKRNIGQFGGDSDAVTIFGESAGGASVHYQMLSPMGKGLFRNAISQSGLANMPWALQKSPAQQAKLFANKLNCNTDNTKEMVSCLKNLPALEIVEIHKEMSDMLRPLITVFVPTIEKDIKDGKTFLSENPIDLMSSGRYNKVPFMIGVNSAEGLLVTPSVVLNETMMTLLNTDWGRNLPPILFFPEDAKPHVLDRIKKFYLNGEKFDLSNPMKHFQSFTNIFSDFVWNFASHGAIKEHSNKQSEPVFAYYYKYDGIFSLSDIFMALKGGLHPIIDMLKLKLTNWFKFSILGQELNRIGSCHGDELSMQFYVPMLAHVGKDARDYAFSKQIVKVWTQFANFDHKSSRSRHLEFMGKQWPPQSPNKELSYMQLNMKPQMIPEPFTKRIEFWKTIVNPHFIVKN